MNLKVCVTDSDLLIYASRFNSTYYLAPPPTLLKSPMPSNPLPYFSSLSSHRRKARESRKVFQEASFQSDGD